MQNLVKSQWKNFFPLISFSFIISTNRVTTRFYISNIKRFTITFYSIPETCKFLLNCALTILCCLYIFLVSEWCPPSQAFRWKDRCGSTPVSPNNFRLIFLLLPIIYQKQVSAGSNYFKRSFFTKNLFWLLCVPIKECLWSHLLNSREDSCAYFLSKKGHKLTNCKPI